MAKVLGTMLTILSALALIGQIFLYQNSNAYLSYNPADKNYGLIDVGLSLPFAMALFFFIAGVVILKTSTEPEKI